MPSESILATRNPQESSAQDNKSPEPSQLSRDFVSNAASALSSLFILQISSRVLTFLLKSASARALGPAQYAFSEISLPLINALALVPTCAARNIALRQENNKSAQSISTCGSLASVVLSFLAIATMLFIKILYQGSDVFDFETQLFIIAYLLTFVSSSGEALSDPLFISATRMQLYSGVGKIKGLALIFSALVTTVLLYTVRGPYAPALTSIGQLFYGQTLLIGFSAIVRLNLRTLSPSLSSSSSSSPTTKTTGFSGFYMLQKINKDQLHLILAAGSQTLVKFFLGDGESLVLLSTCSKEDQGAFRLSGNVGSLVARFFFEPIEEQCFNVFSKLSTYLKAEQQFMEKSLAKDEDTTTITEKQVANICMDFLVSALKSSLYMAVLLAFIGPWFAKLFILIMYGSKWTETNAPLLLSLYFIYLIFMATNGVTEAFVNATGSAKQLKNHTMFTIAVSVIYLMTAVVLSTKFGSRAIILANCLNMLLRSIYNINFISSAFGKLKSPQVANAKDWTWISRLFPPLNVMIVLVVSSVISFKTSKDLNEAGEIIPGTKGLSYLLQLKYYVLSHIFIGFLGTVTYFLAIYRFDRIFIQNAKGLLQRREFRPTKTKSA